jgi:hypothetical protein
LRQATEAFVDRAPIDWTALLQRVSHPRDRALVEHLRALDRVRAPAMPWHGVGEWPGLPAALVRATIALAILQIASGVVLVAVHIATGGRIHDRAVMQAILVASHIASALLLAGTVSRDPRRLFLLSAYLCTASAFVRAASRGIDPSSFAPAAAIVRGVWTEVLTPACMCLFALTFPRVTRFTAFDTIARRLTAAAWVTGLAVFVLNASVASFGLDPEPFASVLPNQSSNIFWRVFTIVDLLAIGAIFLRARRAPPDERRKVWRVAKAIAVCMAPFLAIGIARTIVPAFDAWLVAARRDERLWLDVTIVTALAAAPVLTTLAVIVDRPFDLQGVVRRTWRHAFARRAATVLREQRQLAKDVEAIRLAPHDEERSKTLERALRASLDASFAFVLARSASGELSHAGTRITLSSDTALHALLGATSEPIAFATNAALTVLLPELDRQWLAAHQIDLVAPIVSRGGDLSAIAVAGRTSPRRPFDRRDVWVAATLTAAAAAAWKGRADASDRPGHECSACGAVGDAEEISCGCAASAVRANLPKRLSDRFVVLRRIGAGAAGVVYLARDARLGRDVALKTLPHLRPDAILRLRQEARSMAALDHDALAAIYGLEFWQGTPILAVEYFPGGTLAQQIANGPLPPTSVVRLGIALARALGCMHDRGVLHRDLKPTNIGVTASGAYKLLDFGLSTIAGSFATTRVAGTPAYLPPEAYRGGRADGRVDLWALGVVLVEALTGTDPRWLANGLPADVRGACDEAHRQLATVLGRALARNVDERFQTSAGFLSALTSLEVPR